MEFVILLYAVTECGTMVYGVMEPGKMLFWVMERCLCCMV